MAQSLIPKKIPKTNLYPKSITSNTTKLEYNPSYFIDRLKGVEYFAFGDSFVNMFLHAENAFYIKLKGKSIKGLAKAEKQERLLIEKWVNVIPKHITLIFNFGQVDLNFIRYYKIIHGETYPPETFQEYVNWISSLKRKSIVIGIFASPINEENIVETLQKYNTLEDIEPNPELILKQHEKTESTRKQWNDLIERVCDKKMVRFLNIFEHDKKINEKFLDQNPKTIHLRYLPCIIEVQKHIPQLKIDIRKSLEIEQEYVAQKTQRYYKNLQLLEQSKRTALEQQEMTTGSNSSKDLLQDQDLNSKASANTETNSKKESENAFQNQIKHQLDKKPHVETKEIFQPVSSIKSKQGFVQLLAIPGILDQEQLFQEIKKLNHPDFLHFLADRIIKLGIFWVATKNKSCSMFQFYLMNSLNLINNINQSQQKIECNQCQLEKIVRSELQKYFQQNLYATGKSRAIEEIVSLIIYMNAYQKYFKLSLIPQKLIFIVFKQVVAAIFMKLLSKNPETKVGIVADYNIFSILIFQFKSKMNKVFVKQSAQKNFKPSYEKQFCQKVTQLILTKKLTEEQLAEKVKNFDQLLNRSYPYAIFSEVVLKEITKIIDFEVKKTQLEIKSNEKFTAIQSTIFECMNQNIGAFHQKLQNFEKTDESSQKMKKYVEQIKSCKCGCIESAISTAQSLKQKQS